MFCSDKPINNSKDDLLNRTSFSKQLAQAILAYASKDNFTISLCGKWGSGKTSILNMVVEYINDMTKDYAKTEQPIIIHFNPWNYSNSSQLTVQFFKTILTKIKNASENTALKKAGDALQHYSSIIEYIELIPVAGKYFKPLKSLSIGIGKGLLKSYDDRNSLERQKDKVIDALSAQKQKLIVIIDDIDRLNNEQIRLIFRLVNSLAGFPNMIYLLSFDREIVSRALSDEQKCDGEAYLEKIIQVLFDVPEVQMSLVHQIFFDKLYELLFRDIPCDNFEQEYWDNVFQYCIAPFIKGIRDVNRIINVYRFKYGIMHNETNCIDLLALSTFQICAPSIYNWIYINKERIAGDHYGIGTTGIEQNKVKNELLEEFKSVYKTDPEFMLQAIQTLFPKISWKSGGYTHSSETNEELRRKQKIACPTRFPLYFNLSLENIIITKWQMVESINSYNETDLKSLFEKLASENTLNEYMQELLSYVPDIPEHRLAMFLEVLLDALTFEDNHKVKRIFASNSAYKCKQCCWAIFNRLGQDQTTKEIISLIETSSLKRFSIILEMIISIECSYGRIGDSINYNYRVVEENQLDAIENSIKNKLKSLSQKCNLLDVYPFWRIYHIWNYLDKESMNNYLKEALKIASNVPKYLTLKVNIWSSEKDTGWFFKEENFSDCITLNVAYEKIVSLKRTMEFSSLKFEVKEIAVAFYLWYNSDNKEHKDITKQKVDELIPDWEEN